MNKKITLAGFVLITYSFSMYAMDMEREASKKPISSINSCSDARHLQEVRKHFEAFNFTSVMKWKDMFDCLSPQGQQAIIHRLHDKKFIAHKCYQSSCKNTIESTARMMQYSKQQNLQGFYLVPGKGKNHLLKTRLLSKINKLRERAKTDGDKAHLLMLVQLYDIVKKNKKTAGKKVLKCVEYAMLQHAKNQILH